jgi:hypothetical protein
MYITCFVIDNKIPNMLQNAGSRPSSVFLFGIILKEIVAALHRIYLNVSVIYCEIYLPAASLHAHHLHVLTMRILRKN